MLKKKEKEGETHTFLSKNLELDGTLIASGEVLIEGKVSGKVFTDHIVVNGSADIDGELIAKDLTIDGVVSGDILSYNKLHLLENAKVTGKIKSCYLSVDDGALVDSEIEILSPPNNVLTQTPSFKKPKIPVAHRNDEE